MRLSHIALVTATSIALAGCTDSSTSLLSPRPTNTTFSVTSVTQPTTGPWARIVEGVVGPGALYELSIPRTPNGDVIYYSHGIRDVDSPVDLRDADGFYATRDLLGDQGFVVAYSSWSDNGVAIKDAEIQVHQLRGIVASQLSGQPKHSYLMSHSLGSGIALDLAESYPGEYDGAFLMCGMVGGTLLESQYAGNVRALFDVLYPSFKLPGSVLRLPSGTPPVTPQYVAGAVLSQGPPFPSLFTIASLSQTPLPFVPVSRVTQDSMLKTLIGSLYGALSFQTRFANDVYDRAHGHVTFDNSAITYSLGANPLLPAPYLEPFVNMANATAERDTMDAAGRNFMEHYFTPSGDLKIPVLTLHNTWDPGVPAFHEDSLYAKVSAAGATRNLLQRRYDVYGHCIFPPELQAQNFLDLVQWVKIGVRPIT